MLQSVAVFVIASVGGVFFKSDYAGMLLLISTYLAAFISGLTASLVMPPERDASNTSARHVAPGASAVFTSSLRTRSAQS
jgi:hypothetical protein